MNLKYTIPLTLLIATSCLAADYTEYITESACKSAFADVKRADTNIKQQEGNLSSMGKRALYKQIQDNV